MYIKSINKSETRYIDVTIYEATNDIDIDFVCIQEKMLTFDSERFFKLRDEEGAEAALAYISEYVPIKSQLVKEHVFDSPVAVDLYIEVMWGAEVLQCIHAL